MQPNPTFDFDALDADVDRHPIELARVKRAIETDIDVDLPGMLERMGVSVQRLVRRRGGFALSIYNDRFDFAMSLLGRGIELPRPAWRELAETPIRMNDTLAEAGGRGSLNFVPAATIPLGLSLFHHVDLGGGAGNAVEHIQKIQADLFAHGMPTDLVDSDGRGFLVHAASCFMEPIMLVGLLEAGVDANARCLAGKKADDWILEFTEGDSDDERLRVLKSWRAKYAMQTVINKARLKN